jgi:replicative DNA helicase
VLDYFQLFSTKGLSAASARHEQLSTLSRALKQLARSTDISIIVISQQSRTALTSFKKRKDPNTMAGTQALVRDCDLLILVLEKFDEDKEEIPHMRELYVGLSRNSRADVTFDSIFVGKYARTGAPLGDEGDVEQLENMPEAKDEQLGWWHK